MDQNRIEFIYRRCLSNTATVEERREFKRLIRLPENKEAAKTILLASFYENQRDVNFDDISAEAMIEAILLSDKNITTPTADFKSEADKLIDSTPVHRIHFLKTTWFRYAAILLLIAGTATYLYITHQPSSQRKHGVIASYDAWKQQNIPAGGNKAILTLADGSNIILDSAANGALAKQGNTQILKPEDGKLAYHAGAVGEKPLYNTISTPQGGQYQVTLSDGTKIWLNAASSVRFPATFGKERTVEITGEAYLEVAASKSKPFYATAGPMTVQVLGTSFNINTYNNEPAAKISLVLGSVKINNSILKPGQAYMAGKVTETDLERDVAWKNGFFQFEQMDLPAVMRQISRWYDVEVSYRGVVPKKEFGGRLPRSMALNSLLKLIEFGDVRLEVSGKHITVVGR